MRATPHRLAALVVASLIAATAAGAPTARAAAPSMPPKQEEWRRVQRRLEGERQRLVQTRRRERRMLDDVQRLDRQIDASESRLARVAASQRQARLRSEAAAAALARAEMALARRRAALADRLRDMHRHGRAGYLDVVLGAASFPEFVTRARMVNAIVRDDARAINAYTTDRDRTEVLQAELLVEQRRLAALREETEERRRHLAGQARAKRAALQAVVRERAAAERAIRDLEEDSRRLEALLRSLQSGAAAGGRLVLAGFVMPLRGAVTSRFGFRRHPIFRLRQFHQGVDIAAPRGTPVVAASGGRVLFADWYGGYGKLVVLDHGQGLSSLYGHLSVILVRPGQTVARGQVIGRVGSTGYSTGPHLHYEIRQHGRPVDPFAR